MAVLCGFAYSLSPLACIHSLLVAQRCVRAVGALLALSPPEHSVLIPLWCSQTLSALMWGLLKVGKMNLLKWPVLSQVGLEWSAASPVSSFGVPSSILWGFVPEQSVGPHAGGC